MTQEEIIGYVQKYTLNTLTIKEVMEIGRNFRNYVDEHFAPIPKKELVIGKEYDGYCRNATKAIWNGEKFHYEHYECGFLVPETINHYEDDNGYDVFVPIKKL